MTVVWICLVLLVIVTLLLSTILWIILREIHAIKSQIARMAFDQGTAVKESREKYVEVNDLIRSLRLLVVAAHADIKNILSYTNSRM